MITVIDADDIAPATFGEYTIDIKLSVVSISVQVSVSDGVIVLDISKANVFGLSWFTGGVRTIAEAQILKIAVGMPFKVSKIGGNLVASVPGIRFLSALIADGTMRVRMEKA